MLFAYLLQSCYYSNIKCSKVSLWKNILKGGGKTILNLLNILLTNATSIITLLTAFVIALNQFKKARDVPTVISTPQSKLFFEFKITFKK